MARLRRGVDVFAGDEITSTALAHATIQFADKSILALNPTTSIRFDRFVYEQKVPDAFRTTVFHGALAMIAGRIANVPDTLIIDAGPMTLSVHGANMLCRLSPNGTKAEVTLLGGDSESCSEILVHNNVAVETLNQPNHTLRIDGKYGYVSVPMTTTTQVLESAYRGTAIGHLLGDLATDKKSSPGDPPLSVFDTEMSGFEFFENLSDRLLERRFLSQHIFPDDVKSSSTLHNELLEDAFDGERFRLKNCVDPD